MLTTGGGPSVEKDLGYGLLPDIESIVDFALLGAQVQQTLPCTLQKSHPQKGGVFSANDGFGRGPIKHLLAGRVIIEAFDHLHDHLFRGWPLAESLGGHLYINPGSTEFAVHREVCRDSLVPIVDRCLEEDERRGIRDSEKRPNHQYTHYQFVSE